MRNNSFKNNIEAATNSNKVRDGKHQPPGGNPLPVSRESFSLGTRERETSITIPTPEKVPLSQVNQTGTLDWQAPNSQRDQTVIRVRLNSPGHESMCVASVVHPEAGENGALSTPYKGVRPGTQSSGRDLSHLGCDCQVIPDGLPQA